METTVDTLGNSGKTTPLKRINAGILQACKRIKLRSVGAILLGSAAGLSLTASVLPTVLEALGIGDLFFIRWSLADYAVYAMMAWGVGGWAARRVAGALGGALILGLVGLVSSTLVMYAALGTSSSMLFGGSAAGTAYGAIGGLLIARTLGGERHHDTQSSGTASRESQSRKQTVEKIEPVRLFRFFR